MATIRTKATFHAPAHQVWSHMTDADLLQRLGACDSIRGIGTNAGGLFEEGAVREVRMGNYWQCFLSGKEIGKHSKVTVFTGLVVRNIAPLYRAEGSPPLH